MNTRNLIACLLAPLCLTLMLNGGCTKKGIQATSEDEGLQVGSTAAGNSVGSGAGTGRGQGETGISEEALDGSRFGQPGGAGSDPISEGDIGLGGPSGAGSGGDAGGHGGPDEEGPFGGMSGGFGGAGEFDPSMGPEGERGGVGAFPDVSGGRSSGSQSSGSFGEFESVEPGQMPPEDRLEEEGAMIAKVEPSDAVESQMEAMREDRGSRVAYEFEDVFFGFDSWNISEQAKVSLSESAVWLKANPSTKLMVEGHCDERGSAAYNLVLGEKRAKAVRIYLMELGVAPKRVTVVSYGEERPFCSDSSESCYQLNRRGHLLAR